MIRRPLCYSLLFIAVAWTTLPDSSAPVAHGAPAVTDTPIPDVPPAVKLDFERYARELPYLALGSVVYDRDGHSFVVDDRAVEKLHFQILTEVAAPRYSTEALTGLLWHADPKVRTLAVAALFDREDATVLPHVARLTGDERRTFDGYPKLSDDWLQRTGIGPPALEQSVATFARAFVEQYCPLQDFPKYWSERKNRKFCASWFAVQLKRAGQGISPIAADRDERFAALRKRIDQLPRDDAAWTLIYLFGNYDGAGLRLVDERELVRRCKELGREKILLALQRKIPSDDPDLKQGYSYSLSFLLRNAKEFLSPADVDALLECERNDLEQPHSPRQFTAPIPYWFTAAADLDPARAGEYIRTGLTRFPSKYDGFRRAQLVAKLWEVREAEETEFVVNWFFDVKGSEGSHPHPSEAFLGFAARNDRPELRRLLAKIIGDKRLETLNSYALRELATTVGAWTEKPVATQEEIDSFRSDGRLYWLKDAATVRPDEYRRYMRVRTAWIERLRAEVPHFLPTN